MSLFAILGSGFGLYGYLPALISCGQSIILPKRYQARFAARKELAPFASQISWGQDEADVLKQASGAVFALNPGMQYSLLSQSLKDNSLEHFLLEKPLAPSPDNAALLFENLVHSGKNFRIGYVFRYTTWGKQLLEVLDSAHGINSISIQWRFMAHHFQHNLQNWKRFHSMGGGVIRFYGIQVIALLAELGYRHVVLSDTKGCSIDECEQWHAVFTGKGLPDCDVFIDSKSSNTEFQVEQKFHSINGQKKADFIMNFRDPFDVDSKECSTEALDPRVTILNQLCLSLWKADTYEWYAATIQLWREVEVHYLVNRNPDEKKINQHS